MKTFLGLFIVICFSSAISAQNYDAVTKGDLKTFAVTQNPNVPFRLFPTQNNWNYMKLDTRTGQIWMVQFSIKKTEDSFTWILDDSKIEEAIPENIGRFTLYPTSNIFNYILLDQFDGRTWQVQYSLENIESNFRIRIY